MMAKPFRSLWVQLFLTPMLCLVVAATPFFCMHGVQVLEGKPLISDNVLTTGRVLTVGQSVVNNGPSVIGFGYNVPGNTHTPWSFEREQKVDAADLKKFWVGQRVQVEYSHSISGSARLCGYGRTSSVYGDETLEDMTMMLRSFLPIYALALLFQWAKIRWRQKREPQSPAMPANC